MLAIRSRVETRNKNGENNVWIMDMFYIFFTIYLSMFSNLVLSSTENDADAHISQQVLVI